MISGTWNYRVFLEVDPRTKNPTYSVRSAYYRAKGDSIPNSWGKEINGSYLCSDDYADLKQDWELYGEAFKKPILFIKGNDIKELTDEDKLL